MTSWSWTRRHSRATPCQLTRSRAAASSSSAAGIARRGPGQRCPAHPAHHVPCPWQLNHRPVKLKAGTDFVVAPRRYVLDTIIAAAAERAGADVRPGVTVTGVRRNGRGRVVGVYGHDRSGAPVDIGARYVIGADGLQSRIARSAGAAIREARPANGATQYAYYAGIPWTGSEFFVGPRSLLASSRLTTGRPASGYATPPPTRKPSAAGTRRAKRLSASCLSVPPRS